MSVNTNNAYGKISISDLAIAKVASNTAMESYGIVEMVSRRFTELTGITKEMMLEGISLTDAVKQYNNWLGEDTVTITWSNSDLYTIAENEKYILDGSRFKIDKYLD